MLSQVRKLKITSLHRSNIFFSALIDIYIYTYVHDFGQKLINRL